MKISKYRDIDDVEERDHKKAVEKELKEIKENNNEKLDKLISQTSKLETQEELSELREIKISLDGEIKEAIKNVKPRSERTKIYNKKIEEDLIILETTDDLFSPEEPCLGMFEYSPNFSEANQFFILEETASENRCQERIYSFDKDQPLAIRLDSYEGDEHGFFRAPGLNNNSSDILIKNDTLYEVKIRTDSRTDHYTVGDGFSLTLNDIEKEDPVLVKRDNTISGYTLTFVVEEKANS